MTRLLTNNTNLPFLSRDVFNYRLRFWPASNPSDSVASDPLKETRAPYVKITSTVTKEAGGKASGMRRTGDVVPEELR